MGGLSCESLSARRAWIEMPGNIRGRCVCCVALRKESVDRNVRPPAGPHVAHKSLSARRAWIEIWHIHGFLRGLPSLSARRAWIEIIKKGRARRPGQSLSARRAWIEILIAITPSNFSNVALRKESVDRNSAVKRWAYCNVIRRSPQGERG